MISIHAVGNKMSKEKTNEQEPVKNPFAVDEASVASQEENIEDKQTEEKPTEENPEIENNDNAACENCEKLQENLNALNNKYIRLAADFDNFRKRQMQERESLLKYGAENTLKLILPVLDNYERAKKACEKIDDPEQLRNSFEVVFKQLFDVLDKTGLKRIETKGKNFDPNIHEAVMQTPTSEFPDQTIIDELQAGFMLEDKVLRPALVNVATGE